MSQVKVIRRKTRRNRIRKRVSGTALRPRLTVFKSLKATYAQLINDETGQTLAAASDLKTKNKAAKAARAHEIGLELARRATEKNISQCVFDRSGYKYHGRVKAVADGAREGGLKF